MRATVRLFCIAFLCIVTADVLAADDSAKRARARSLLDKADKLSEAEDFAGALNAYIDAVKIDPAAADLDAIRKYAFSFVFSIKTEEDPEKQRAQEERARKAREPHRVALRQYLQLKPEDWKATSELLAIAEMPEADSLLAKAVKARPSDPEVYAARAGINAKFGRHAASLEDWKKASDLDPANAERHYILGVGTYEAVVKAPDFTDDQRRVLIRRGLEALDRAEAARADYFESIVYRSLLLRKQAAMEKDPANQKKLNDSADALREGAIALPELPPIVGEPIRMGDGVKAPVVIERVKPEYPQLARKAHMAGIVIVEALIDKTGHVRDAKIIKGLPFGIDDAAIAAVKQWTFRPATRDGEPVDVVFNLTVRFPPE